MRRLILLLCFILTMFANMMAGEHRTVIISLDGCRWDYPFGFLKTNIEYLSKKDSIDYVLPDDIYFNIYSENVDYNKSYSIHELASNYVTLVPDDMCFSIKNLENTNDKTLIKT